MSNKAIMDKQLHEFRCPICEFHFFTVFRPDIQAEKYQELRTCCCGAEMEDLPESAGPVPDGYMKEIAGLVSEVQSRHGLGADGKIDLLELELERIRRANQKGHQFQFLKPSRIAEGPHDI